MPSTRGGWRLLCRGTSSDCIRPRVCPAAQPKSDSWLKGQMPLCTTPGSGTLSTVRCCCDNLQRSLLSVREGRRTPVVMAGSVRCNGSLSRHTLSTLRCHVIATGATAHHLNYCVKRAIIHVLHVRSYPRLCAIETARLTEHHARNIDTIRIDHAGSCGGVISAPPAFGGGFSFTRFGGRRAAPVGGLPSERRMQCPNQSACTVREKRRRCRWQGTGS